MGVVEGVVGKMLIANSIPLVIDPQLFLLRYFSKSFRQTKLPKQENPVSLLLGLVTHNCPPSDFKMSQQSEAATGEK